MTFLKGIFSELVVLSNIQRSQFWIIIGMPGLQECSDGRKRFGANIDLVDSATAGVAYFLGCAEGAWNRFLPLYGC